MTPTFDSKNNEEHIRVVEEIIPKYKLTSYEYREIHNVNIARWCDADVYDDLKLSVRTEYKRLIKGRMKSFRTQHAPRRVARVITPCVCRNTNPRCQCRRKQWFATVKLYSELRQARTDTCTVFPGHTSVFPANCYRPRRLNGCVRTVEILKPFIESQLTR